MVANDPDSRPKRIDLGFAGGMVLALRVSGAEYDSLRAALDSDHSSRWHQVEAEESAVSVDLSQVVYVRLDTDKQRVGF